MNEQMEITEDGESFEANALIKAKQVYNKFKLPTIADDSGLMVDQLNGAPGNLFCTLCGRRWKR